MSTTLQQDISTFLADFNHRKQQKASRDSYVVSKFNEAIDSIFTYFNAVDRPFVLCKPKFCLLEIRTTFSPLTFIPNTKSRLDIELNNYFEPVYTFNTQLQNDSSVDFAKIKMNHLFKVQSVKFYYKNEVVIIGNNHPLFPFLKLFTDVDNDELQTMFSEYSQPGVYDFTSDEFSDKLTILDMMYI